MKNLESLNSWLEKQNRIKNAPGLALRDVQVQAKDGKTYTRKQWMRISEDRPHPRALKVAPTIAEKPREKPQQDQPSAASQTREEPLITPEKRLAFQNFLRDRPIQDLKDQLIEFQIEQRTLFEDVRDARKIQDMFSGRAHALAMLSRDQEAKKFLDQASVLDSQIKEKELRIQKMAVLLEMAQGEVERRKIVFVNPDENYRLARDVYNAASPEEKEMISARIVGETRLYEGSNLVKKVQLQGGKTAIFKSQRGETELAKGMIESGTYFRREVAAYKMAQYLGVDRLVPRTTMRFVEGDLGSLQEFVPNASPIRPPDVAEDDILDAAFFDAVIGNADRHHFNAIFQGNKMFLIDHGLSFVPRSAYDRGKIAHRSYLLKEVQNKNLNPRHADALKKVLSGRESISKSLASILSDDDIEGIFYRAEKMLSTNKYGFEQKWETF